MQIIFISHFSQVTEGCHSNKIRELKRKKDKKTRIWHMEIPGGGKTRERREMKGNSKNDSCAPDLSAVTQETDTEGCQY